jgi:hypothetical protein
MSVDVQGAVADGALSL